NTIWLGILLTGLVLFIFLHDFRSTLIVALSMPISIISTFIFLKAAGFTLNLLTLTGFSTAVGILVTNSVVVIENIFRHRDMGNNRKDAAFKGTSEITVAVLASTLTNIVVFLPIASMSSMVGGFLKEFALTVTFATIFSLIASFTITPMLASLIIPEKQKSGKFGLWFDGLFDRFGESYQKFMKLVLKNKKTALAVVLSSILLLGLSLLLVPGLGFELLPAMDQGNITVSIELPEGVNLNETAAVVKEVNERCARHSEIEHIVSNIGSSGISTGMNLANADIKLKDKKERSLSNLDLVNVLTNDLSDIPGAIIKVSDQGGIAAMG
ncbi:MAG: efflux RND transporter permease subunit, partial [Candidatus Cloacimonetes bacterium]|nr:efflux RND transporter permease subunit [Candidatus Cloacimonadota bacterium]